MKWTTTTSSGQTFHVGRTEDEHLVLAVRHESGRWILRDDTTGTTSAHESLARAKRQVMVDVACRQLEAQLKGPLGKAIAEVLDTEVPR